MNDFDRMFNKVAKEQNYAAAKRAANTSMLTLQDYLISCKTPDGETKVLKKLSEIFEELSPFWVNDFQKLEQQKEKIFRTPLAKKVNLYDDILSEADGIDTDNATTIALHVYLANKIAHAYQAKQNNLISELLERKKISHNKDDENFSNLSNLFRTYFALSNSLSTHFNIKINGEKDIENFLKNVNTPEDAKKALKRLRSLRQNAELSRFYDSDFRKLDEAGMANAIQMQEHAFAIKDAAMSKLILKLQARDEAYKKTTNTSIDSDLPLSYGMIKDENDKPILVVDLPVFGQFSVHMKTPESISALSTTPYTKLLLDTKSVMLTTEMSESAEKDSEDIFDPDTYKISSKAVKRSATQTLTSQDNTPSNDEIKKYGHYLINKNGGEKKDLDDFYDELH